MAKGFFWIVKFFMVLVFGIIIVGCAKLDTSINGTWGNEEEEREITFNNGSFEECIDGDYFKGTYTTAEGIIYKKITHIKGQENEEWININDLEKHYAKGWESYSLESDKEYYFKQRDETIELLRSVGATDDEIRRIEDDYKWVEDMEKVDVSAEIAKELEDSLNYIKRFESPMPYSVSGIILNTICYDFGRPIELTRIK